MTAPDALQDRHSPTRDQTHAPCSGYVESYPLSHQGSLCVLSFRGLAARLRSPLLHQDAPSHLGALYHQIEALSPGSSPLTCPTEKLVELSVHCCATFCALCLMRQPTRLMSCLSESSFGISFSPPFPRLCPAPFPPSILSLECSCYSLFANNSHFSFFHWPAALHPQLLQDISSVRSAVLWCLAFLPLQLYRPRAVSLGPIPQLLSAL